MIDKRTIVHKLATKYNLPLEVVEGIVNYQFKFVSKIMKEGDFEAIGLPYFGKFSVNLNRVKYITKLKDEAAR